jgi:diguanylate cyclase (GGDEF)-like protein
MAAGRTGKVFRLAGEEFTVLFPKKTAGETLVALERIRKTVEETTIYLGRHDRIIEGGQSLRGRSGKEELVVTASIGLAETGHSGASLDQVTKAAYRALYEAKGVGGNQVKRGSVILEPLRRSHAETGRIVAYSEFENS